MSLTDITLTLRRRMLDVLVKTKGGHIGGSLSAAEIYTALYFGGVLRYRPEEPDWSERDRFVLSKGHASLGLFCTLAAAGFFSETELDSYTLPGSRLGGHPKRDEVPGVEASTGALGHGFPFAGGIALAGQLDERDYRVYCLLGDGECQEGSVWEAAMFAAQQRLGNLVAIVDYNKLQAMDQLTKIVDLAPFAEKWRSFGWDVQEVDGHDLGALINILNIPRQGREKPLCVLAHTVKGKGISYMENQPLWHVRVPNDEERKIAEAELAAAGEVQ
ncbi:MAG TPA: transketolase [Patescibacteria group bacterium]|nr:transketolase [Patescibacteria group bacterium]